MNSALAGGPQSRTDSKQGRGGSKRWIGHEKRRGRVSVPDSAEKIVVAVKASKEIAKHALEWALTHVVQPGDCITLLAVVSGDKTGRKLWGFPIFAGDCANGHKKSHGGNNCSQELHDKISDSCFRMMLQLNEICDSKKISVKVKVVSAAAPGATAAEAKKSRATWVVLDKQLKKEEKSCMEELHCNLVVMKRSSPKILRLNLLGSPRLDSIDYSSLFADFRDVEDQTIGKSTGKVLESVHGQVVTPSSSPELGTPFTATEIATSSASSSEQGASPFLVSEATTGLNLSKPTETTVTEQSYDDEETTDSGDALANSDSDTEDSTILSTDFDFPIQRRMDPQRHQAYGDFYPVEVKKSGLVQSPSRGAGVLFQPVLPLNLSEQFSSSARVSSRTKEES